MTPKAFAWFSSVVVSPMYVLHTGVVPPSAPPRNLTATAAARLLQKPNARLKTAVISAPKSKTGRRPIESESRPYAYLRAEGERHGKVRIKLALGEGPGYGIAWGCDRIPGCGLPGKE